MAADLIITDAPGTETDAVNVLIACVSEGPYDTISPSPSPDVDKAIKALNEANRQLQSRGWDWNREYAYPLTLAADGTCPLPSNCLRVTQAYYTPTMNSLGTSGNYSLFKFTKRGGLLYDQLNHTFTLQAAPLVDMILLLSWADMPESARILITYEAAKKFIAREQMSNPTQTVNEDDRKQAWKVVEQEEDEVNQHNAIHGNLHVRAALYGEGSMRRNRSGLT